MPGWAEKDSDFRTHSFKHHEPQSRGESQRRDTDHTWELQEASQESTYISGGDRMAEGKGERIQEDAVSER